MSFNFNNHNYYPFELPQIYDKVICMCIDISYDGCNVVLPEYSNIPALIPYKELSKTRIKNINSVVKKNAIFVAEVINVDINKKYIDLSKKSVNVNEYNNAIDKYNKSKRVHSILNRLSNDTGITINDLYTKYIWDIYNKFEHPDLIFYNISKDNLVYPLDKIMGLELFNKFKDIINKSYVSKKINLTAKFSINCIGKDGINAIKNVLNQVLSEYPNLDISLISTPTYLINYYADPTTENINYINNALNKITEYIQLIEGGDSKIIQLCIYNDNNNEENYISLDYKEIENDTNLD
jgi:translation initiation factor 2 alpha subunit (eIF-2alpha)